MRRWMLWVVLVLCAGVAWGQVPGTGVEQDQNVDHLLKQLANKNAPLTRITAAKRLSELCIPSTAPALLVALNDPQPEVRTAAATALGIIGSPTAVSGLVKLAVPGTPTAQRLAAIIALGRLADPQGVASLATASRDADISVRQAAVTALSQINDATSTASLQKATGDPNSDVSATALLALAQRHDHSIVPRCLEQLKAPGPPNRRIVRALALLGDLQAAPALLELAQSTADPNIQRDACIGLARTGDPKTIDQMMVMLNATVSALHTSTEFEKVWAPAMRALPIGEATRVLQPLLRQDSLLLSTSLAAPILAQQYDYRKAGLLDLLKPGTRVHPWLLSAWVRMRQPDGIDEPLFSNPSGYLLYTLTQPRSWRDSEQLEDLLGAPSPWIAFAGPSITRSCWRLTPALITKSIANIDQLDGLQGTRIANLGYADDPSVYTSINFAMQHVPHEPDGSPAIDAMWFGNAFSYLGNPDAIPALQNLQTTTTSWQTLEGLTRGISGSADARDVATYELLLQSLRSPNAAVRKSALAGLGCCREARAVPEITACLQSESVSDVRSFCARALGLIGDTRAVEALCATLHDKIASVRSAAAWGLGQLGDPRAIPALQQAVSMETNNAVRAYSAESLNLLGDPNAGGILLEMTQDKDWDVCAAANRSLANCTAPSITGSMVTQLYRTPSPMLIEAIGRQRGEQAIPPLLQLLVATEYEMPGLEIRQLAARALGRICAGRSGDQVTRVADQLYDSSLYDTDTAVRACAAIALARIGDPRATERIAWVMQEYVPERNGAIRALWNLNTPQANALLREALQDDDPLGQVLAARGLMLHKIPEGPAALRDLLATVTEPVARQLAIRFAAELHDPALTPTFVGLATATPQTVKMRLTLEAIAALGTCQDPAATPTLIALLDSPASPLREAAAHALTGTKAAAARRALQAHLASEQATRVRAAIGAALEKQP